MSMSCCADPYSGTAHPLPQGWPQWSKGEKLSDSGEEMGDSSDQSSVIQDSSDESGSEDEAERNDSGVGGVDLESTPKGKGRISKGKGRAKQQQEAVITGSPGRLSSTPSTAKSTIRPRPRSNSKPSSFAPGPAATAMSKMTMSSAFLPATMNAVAGPSTSGLLRSGIATRKPLSHNSRSGTLGRATSAPTNLFGGSPPVIRKSPAPKYRQADAPTSPDPETEEDEQVEYPSSPESSIDCIINRAYERMDSDIDLVGRSLTTLPDTISELANFITLDRKTGISGPTPIRLYLSSNLLTSAGLTPALFTIKNLDQLYLRTNNLETLPQAIGQLKNLKQLHLFNNKLQYLPAEIMDLKLSVLQLGSNTFMQYDAAVGKMEKKDETTNMKSEMSAEAVSTELSAKYRNLAPRKQSFKVPSLLELCTRKLLEPMPTLPISSKIKSFSPTTSVKPTKRYFNDVKDDILSSRDELSHPPAHLLQPFLPLLQPLPHHLRYLTPTKPTEPVSAEILQCSVCKTACTAFAEERLEWRNEVAGVKICPEDDKENWVPIMWRGCSANCLDFLEEPL